MVGFIYETSIEEEESLNHILKTKNPAPSPILTDQTLSDLALADTFLDFDSIKDWFEQFPEEPGILQTSEYGSSMVKEEKVENEYHGPFSLGSSFGCSTNQLGVNEVCVKRETVCEETESGMDIISHHGKADGLSGGLGSLVKGGNTSEYGNAKIDRIPIVVGVDGLKSDAIINVVTSEKVGDEKEESESEDESESASSSSTSSSSCSEDEDDYKNNNYVMKEGRMEIKGKKGIEVDEIEEGEIREDGEMDMVSNSNDDDDDDAEEMVSYSDVEDDIGGGPIKSKNDVTFLPPVPQVQATLKPNHRMLHVGVVLSVFGAQVIVEGVEKHAPLNEGSILWITENRSPLGIVDEIFGPVKHPYYVVRYNCEAEVPPGICQGDLVSYVPEFASFVLNEKNLYKKGYDASGDNDEEVSNEAEFSDDEKEAEYKRSLRMAKRGCADTNDHHRDLIINKWKTSRRKGRNGENKSNNNNNGNGKTPSIQANGGGMQNQDHIHGNGAFPSTIPFPPGFMNGNGMGMAPPFHSSPNVGMPMPCPWPHQQGNINNQLPFQFQLPMLNQMLFANQLPNMGVGQLNAPRGPTSASWPGPVVQNGHNQPSGGREEGMQQQQVQGTSCSGIREALRPFSSGAPFGFGRGGKPPYHRGGGRGRKHCG